MDVRDFAQHVGTGFRFGVDKEKVADRLVGLAQEIRGGKVMVMRVTVNAVAAPDDYANVILALTLCEKDEAVR